MVSGNTPGGCKCVALTPGGGGMPGGGNVETPGGGMLGGHKVLCVPVGRILGGGTLMGVTPRGRMPDDGTLC